MRHRDRLALMIWVWALAASAIAKTPVKQPNVLFIAVDDLKPTLGCYGDGFAKSPNIDRLASSGMVFMNAHCQQAVCAPSRISLLTGLLPDTTRVWDLKTNVRDTLPDVVTLPQHFKQNGYEVVGMGKIFDPRSVGGREHMDTRSWSQPYLHPKSPADETFGYRAPKLVERITAKKKELRGKGWDAALKVVGKFPTDVADVADVDYFDGAMTDEGVRMIGELSKGDKPFFLAVGFKKPHLPFNAPKRYWDLYDRETVPLATIRDMPEGAPDFHFQPGWELRNYDRIPKEGRLPEDLQRELVHGYYACVSYIDALVGKLLDAVEGNGIADETIIILWGDHGWHLGDHSIWCKHTNFEQATRVPMILTVPGNESRAQKTMAPVEFLDVFPTLCELSGIPTPEDLHGTSLLPLIDDPNGSIKRVARSQYPRHSEHGPVMGYAYRDDRYRYIEWVQKRFMKGETDGPVVARELYDYEKDPDETRNLIDDPAYKEVVASMQAVAKKLR
ncbi:MAG: sulfatase [Kiritimatiellae bacterium]|nr:sulfatase [Kiritimatiellia bacterium]